MKDTSFLAAVLIQRIMNRGARALFFVIDACRNNPYAQPGSGRSIGAQRGLAKIDVAKGIFVLLSAGQGQEALDSLNTPNARQRDMARNSVFTRIFLEELRRTGVSHIDVAKNVQMRVYELARQVGHDQVPTFTDQILGKVIFRDGPQPPPPPLPPSPPSGPDPRATDVVKEFYAALERADGDRASSLVVPEKREHGGFRAFAITEYHSKLKKPVRLVKLIRLGSNRYRVHTEFHTPQRACSEELILTIVQRNDRFLIERICLQRKLCSGSPPEQRQCE